VKAIRKYQERKGIVEEGICRDEVRGVQEEKGEVGIEGRSTVVAGLDDEEAGGGLRRRAEGRVDVEEKNNGDT
jgi:hypothetical protein